MAPAVVLGAESDQVVRSIPPAFADGVHVVNLQPARLAAALALSVDVSATPLVAEVYLAADCGRERLATGLRGLGRGRCRSESAALLNPMPLGSFDRISAPEILLRNCDDHLLEADRTTACLA
jgi:hypothetical protein